jgi:hypothetical protein
MIVARTPPLLRWLRAAALGACLASPLACATGHGHFDFDPQASFAAYRTFAFVFPEPASEEVPVPTGDVVTSQLVERHVRAALERELGVKGLEVAAVEQADLLVAFNVSSRQASRTDVYPSGGYYWPHDWWHAHWDYAYTRIYTEGLMIVDLVDAKTRKLVWRGWTADALPRSGEYQGIVDHAVHEVMRNFPPAQPAQP